MTTQYSPELHARLRELHRQASPAPWVVDENDDQRYVCPDGYEVINTDAAHIYTIDTKISVGARNALPALLDEIERLTEAVKAAKAESFETGKKEAVTSIIYILEEMQDSREIAETAATVPGETGRQKVIDAWEELLDDPATYISEKIAPTLIGHTYEEVMAESATYIKKKKSKAWQEGYADGYSDHINVSMIEAGLRKTTTNPYQENN
ncbi:hypothetical protein ACN08Y_10370 [Rothia sp. P5764]|uniref:hypothetical protein n=1 Tax=Rothia sp. P5764 TaxID=3402654 RepID=UPI003ABF5A1C